jgi:hypothetical protein
MRITLTDVAKPPALGGTSLEYASGTAVLAHVETEQRPTVLGLIASGRMRPEAGTVTLDDQADAPGLRARVALVDAPRASEPQSTLTVAGVVSDELLFAGRASGRPAVRAVLDEYGFDDHAQETIGEVAPEVRIRLLVELALARPGVQGIVLVTPDRHGGDPADFWRVACDAASRGFAVLVLCGGAAVRTITGAAEAPDVFTFLAAASSPEQDPVPAEESVVSTDAPSTATDAAAPTDGSDTAATAPYSTTVLDNTAVLDDTTNRDSTPTTEEKTTTAEKTEEPVLSSMTPSVSAVSGALHRAPVATDHKRA